MIEALIFTLIPCATVFAGFKLWLDRMHPQKKPDPSGAELLEALTAHKAEMERQVAVLHGKLTVKQATRLRE